ncbi:MAG TPA: hypothetical protein HA308_00235 [Candidatus Thalassarchaeaceae archaeon]|nr:hypothetical protein [Candidatus Thalassarchaeaceae archaeon]
MSDTNFAASRLTLSWRKGSDINTNKRSTKDNDLALSDMDFNPRVVGNLTMLKIWFANWNY